MHPFGGLPGNLASFCAVLRRDHGFRIGAGELMDAARALDVVSLSDPRSVRHALRAVLAGTRDDAVAFDPAFDRFFLRAAMAAAHAAAARAGEEPRGGPAREEPAPPPPDAAAPADVDRPGDDRLGRARPVRLSDDEGGEPGAFIGASYSPGEEAGDAAPELAPADDAWVAAARALVARLQLGLSRRWQPSRRRRRFDPRRTLRASLQTGGEPLAARWRDRRRRAPRLVMLIDGSRSMTAHAPAALRLAVSLASATPRISVFTFSTTVQPATGAVRQAAQGIASRLPASAFAWGGGTRIGGSLAAFLRRFGERLIRRDTIVIIVSDGLDVGEPGDLQASMAELRRRSAGIVWLNPLLDTPGYEPTAAGMRIALPFASTFTAVNDLDGMVRMSRSVRLRA